MAETVVSFVGFFPWNRSGKSFNSPIFNLWYDQVVTTDNPITQNYTIIRRTITQIQLPEWIAAILSHSFSLVTSEVN